MIGYFIYKCWNEMPFWQKALWTGILIANIDDCQKNEARPDDRGPAYISAPADIRTIDRTRLNPENPGYGR